MVRSYMHENKDDNRRRRRETEQYQLRQQRREEALQKKRSATVSKSSRIPNFITLRNNLMSNDLKEVFQGTYEFRTLLSIETLPPIQEVIDTNLVPRFVELLSPSNAIYREENPDLVRSTRLESAWVLTNIASGSTSQTSVVIDCGAIPLLLQMLREEDELVDQAVWALGNIAGDSEKMRDAIINCKCLDLIFQLFYKRDMKIIRNATWLLSNLCRGRNPPPSYDHLQRCLPIFVHLIEYNDTDVLYDSFWALSYICDIEPSMLLTDCPSTEEVLQNGSRNFGNFVLDKAKAFLEKGSARITAPIIRMIGNVVTGNDAQTNIVIEKGFLPVIKRIFYNYEDYKKLGRIRKEICWTISNICAGTKSQVEAVIGSGLIPMLVEALNLPEMYVRTEACWAITNCFNYVSSENLNVFLGNDVIKELREFLLVSSSISEIQVQILDAFKKILVVGLEIEKSTGKNLVKKTFTDLEIVADLEDLQESNEKSISDRAYELVDVFFNEVDN